MKKIKSHLKKATVYWITGLSGSGKTSISKLLLNYLSKYSNTIHLDGDDLRKIFNNTQDYTTKNRKKLALQYAKLCNLLANQNINVICSTISMYESIRQWNRKNIKNYFEIFIKTSLKTLKKRNQKNLYLNFKQGIEKNIVGLDLKYDIPKNPDLIINNNGIISLEQITKDIINFLENNKN